MMARVPAAACGAALALSIVPCIAEAAPAIRIEWPKLQGCPSAAEVQERARAEVARTKGFDDVRAVAEITPPSAPGRSWQLHLRTRTVRGAGERTLEAPSCDGVARAAAVLVGIASVRTGTSTTATDVPLDEIAPPADRIEEPGVLVPPVRHAEPPPGPPSTEGALRLVPSAELGIAIGLLPEVAPLAAVTLGFERSWFRARASVRAVLPQEQHDGGGSADLTAFGASLDACGRLPLSPILGAKIYACGGGAIDDVRADGAGGIEAFDVHRRAILAFGGASAGWNVSRSVRVGADVRVGGSIFRPSFVIDSVSDGQRLLHRAALVRVESTLTLGIVF